MFKVSTKAVSSEKGILYILLVHLEDKDLVKIGITTRPKIEDRVVEILTSIFQQYRRFPYCYPKRFKKTDKILDKEARLHKYFEDYKYTTEHSFSGHTEFFDIELDIVVDAYERLLKGEDLAEKYESKQEPDMA